MEPGFIALFLLAVSGYGQSGEAVSVLRPSSTDTYMLISHTVVNKPGSSVPEDYYTVKHGNNYLRVRYSSSQTVVHGGKFPVYHNHYPSSDPDMSLIPEVGRPIQQCQISYFEGKPEIASHSTGGPCMVQFGNSLQYERSPNSKKSNYVALFDVLSEKVR